MSYLVMARRWRPKTFSQVVGQNHVTRTLQQAIARGRVAHAYLFTGPRGVGKTTIARLLAKAVNCKSPLLDSEGLPEPCGECDACLDIGTGNSLDVIEIDGASNNRVEDIRTLRENVKFTPSSLARKVYIIDEVHMLSMAAFNALLKTLEEPPEHAMFIFATTEIHKVPATVQSRCQRFDFKRLSSREIRQQLEHITTTDSIDIDQDALIAISIKAEGAMRDALSILDQLIAFQGDERITEDVVQQALGMIGTELFIRTLELAGSGDLARGFTLAEDLNSSGTDPREFLRGLQRHILDLLFLKAGGKLSELEISEVFHDSYRRIVDLLSDEDLLRMGEWAAETEDLLRDAIDPGIRLELFLIRLVKMDSAVQIGALLQKMGISPESWESAPAGIEKKSGVESTAGQLPTPQTDAENQLPSKRESSPPDLKETKSSTEKDDEDNGDDDNLEASSPPPAPSAPSSGGSSPGKPPDGHPAGPDSTTQSPGNGTSNSGQEQLTLEHVRAHWIDICEQIVSSNPLIGSSLESGVPTSMRDTSLEITFSPGSEFEYQSLKRKRGEDVLATFLKEHWSENLHVLFRMGEIPESLLLPARKNRWELRQEKFQKLLDDKPVWKEMVDRFQLKLVNNNR